eukprot:CAMPEP_0182429104 /NCGR_PEP_ID=MMETSP1167-20130531/25519_1 /TAXON_ID=2988 /ORGANISM="Mallomonas Sp, Strain CCMP3275" /LENGTH=459 /DNA_ID=CAMNT_0024612441 /DNA_START=221 /DNA_END=1600 /DNA_ORIENTATION=+
MVAGETGAGKTTFLKTLMKAEEAKAPLIELDSDPEKKFLTIQESGNFLLESIAGDVKFVLYDTPGYGDFVNNEDSIRQIFNDLQQRHENWLGIDAHKITNEERLRMDNRIHCCFYFIQSHRFKNIDKEFISKISDIVPIVPIISKADQMTMDERAAYITHVRQCLTEIADGKEMHVDDLVYDFQEAESTYTETSNEMTQGPDGSMVATATTGKLPRLPNTFAVVCDVRYEREYPWGTVEVKNDEHSDFIRLQKLIFEAGLHIKGLRDMTQRKTIDFLESRDVYRAEQEARENELKREEESKVMKERRMGELEQRVRELTAQLDESKTQMKSQVEKSGSAISALEEQVRLEKEAKLAAVAEAKARADDERKLTDSLLKTKEELHVANNHIAKLRSERDAEIRKAVAAATPPPLPSGMPAMPPNYAPPPGPPNGMPSPPNAPNSAPPTMSGAKASSYLSKR